MIKCYFNINKNFIELISQFLEVFFNELLILKSFTLFWWNEINLTIKQFTFHWFEISDLYIQLLNSFSF